MALNAGTCRGCGQPIIWIRSAAGKPMPCNPEPVKYWESSTARQLIVLPNGVVVTGRLSGPRGGETGEGYISHFATCTKADRFRGR